MANAKQNMFPFKNKHVFSFSLGHNTRVVMQLSRRTVQDVKANAADERTHYYCQPTSIPAGLERGWQVDAHC